MKGFYLIFFLLVTAPIFSQKNGYYILSGTVRDIETNAFLEGANILFSGLSIGAKTDSLGHFSLTLPSRTYQVIIRSLGYKFKIERLELNQNIQINTSLVRAEQLLDEVVITTEKADANVNRVMMGVEKMSAKTLKKLPNLMGESDVIRSIMLLPGVSTVGEGASGFNVRGGNVDQNLVLLDGVPLFNTSHLFGFFTGFNADMVQDLSLFKGGIPAMYGGRSSSVLDIRVKEGNFDKWGIEGGVGPISSRFLIDGPIIQGKTSLILGARGSLSDFYLKYFPNPDLAKSKADFYDVNFKLTHLFGSNQRISLAGYLSNDGFKFASDTVYFWNTRTLSFKHNALIGGRISHNLTAFWSDYSYGIEGNKAAKEFIWKPSIIQKSIKEDLSIELSNKSRVDFGFEYSHFQNDAGSFLPNSPSSSIEKFPMPKEYSREIATYIGHSLKVNQRLSLDYGLRYASYSLLGPYNLAIYQQGVPRALNTLANIKSYENGDVVETLSGFEPRISMAFRIDTSLSVKLGFNRMQQFRHLLSNTMAISPVDIWKNSNPYLPQQMADQISIGLFKNFANAHNAVFETSIELYYKDLKNVLDYVDGASLYINPTIETELLVGKGRAYGAEIFIKKARGLRLTGWVSYTYARTFRQAIADANQGAANFGLEYPANFDTPHNFKFVLNNRLTNRISFNANFTYTSGRPITYPNARYKVYAFNELFDYGYANGIFPRPGLRPTVYQYGGSNNTYLVGSVIQPLLDGYSSPSFTLRNEERIPFYMRLDVGFSVDAKPSKKWQGSWNFSIYNLLARQNVYSIFFRSSTGLTNQARTYQLSILGAAVPSITYNFKF